MLEMQRGKGKFESCHDKRAVINFAIAYLSSSPSILSTYRNKLYNLYSKRYPWHKHNQGNNLSKRIIHHSDDSIIKPIKNYTQAITKDSTQEWNCKHIK
jgi:hypothetical protein